MQVEHLLCWTVADGNGLIPIDGNDAAERIVDDIVQPARAGTFLDMLVNDVAGRKHGLMYAVLAGADKIVGQAVLRRLFNNAAAKTNLGHVF